MKFRFRKIGPIRDAELELGDLTIIVGRNNTGKTYLAYSLYGFLQSWPGWPDLGSFLLDDDWNGAEAGKRLDRRALRTMAQALDARGEARRTVNRETLARERKAVLEALGESFSRLRLASVFSSPVDQFEEARLDALSEEQFPVDLAPRTVSFDRRSRWEFAYDGSEVVLRSLPTGGAGRSSMRMFPHLYTQLLLADLPSPFVLSAERFGISLFFKELDFTKNQLVDLLQKLRDTKDAARFSPYVFIDKTTSRYALPIKDNIDYTRGLPDLRNERSEIYTDKLFDAIKNMVDGYYRASDDEIRFISKRRKEARFEIPLHRASSSVRGLSDLYFFLRHLARKNQLLIVDEPESHLDTRNQVELARLLGRIVHSGLKVLVTTHSDYLVKEMNNLIMRAGLNDGNPTDERTGSADVGLDANRIRAYVAENGSLTACNVDRYGMEMPVFDTTIDDINRSSRELAAKVGEREEGASS